MGAPAAGAVPRPQNTEAAWAMGSPVEKQHRGQKERRCGTESRTESGHMRQPTGATHRGVELALQALRAVWPDGGKRVKGYPEEAYGDMARVCKT